MSTSWNNEDLPPWLRVTPAPDETSQETEAPSEKSIALNTLALELGERANPSGRSAEAQFLRNLARSREIDPDQFTLGHFLNELWADGLTATLYGANTGGLQDKEHFRNLLLRPACEGPLARQHAVGGQTLGFLVYRRQGKLVVREAEVTPHVPLRDFEARVNAPIRWDPDAYMDASDFDAIAQLPCHRAETHERLADWRLYLDWKKQLILANQINVPYSAWRWADEAELEFLVLHEDIPEKLVGQDLVASPPRVDDEDGGRKRAPKPMKLGEVERVIPIDPRDPDERLRWDGAKLTRKHRCVRIRVDEEALEALRHRRPPARGILQSSIAGDLAPIKNQAWGVDRLNKSQSFSPRLADWIFSATSASVPTEVPELADVSGGRNLNAGQREAVAKALAAPDLCLIQGPPGTGKTTVISDICLRATRSGQRVLVASQTNLAVDNALARLADVPWVRPLRLGNADRVDEEFKDFLADNVIDRWFASIAAHCRGRMQQVAQHRTALEERASAVREMTRALKDHAAGTEALRRSRGEVDEARQSLAMCAHAAEQARGNLDNTERRVRQYEALVRWARGEGPLPPTAASESPGDVERGDGIVEQLPTLGELDRARERVEPLRDVLEALGLIANGAATDLAAAEELRDLRRRKADLIDSDEDEDLDELKRINRRLKKLKGSGWSEITGRLHRAASAAWPDAPPPSIGLLVDALGPSAETRVALADARTLTESELGDAEESARTVRGTEEMWQVRLDAVRKVRERARPAMADAEEAVTQAQSALDEATSARDAAKQRVRDATKRWDAASERVAYRPAPEPPSTEALDAAREAVRLAEQALATRLGRAERWRAVQEEWLGRLEQATDTDREHLQKLYVRHSNVVGMTCNEAGKRQTWQDPEFKPFDIVIVDEVSKATPPELILPLLLGRKTVLVGDHRQLPPMFREKDATFGEAAEEGQVTREDYERFRRMVTSSLFEELFERAPEEIKAMLWTQYRMHPRIMDAVNQFYEGRLEPGPDRETLSAARNHHMDVPAAGGGKLVSPNQHLIWVDSSKAPDGRPVYEGQHGTSKLNWLEIDVITSMLLRLGRSFETRGYGATREFEVTRADDGRTWAEVLRCALELPQETLTDLFVERRIRVDGRAVTADGAARLGATVEVRRQKEVGVLTFYGAQLKALRREIDKCRAKNRGAFATMEIRTNTVDKFQGMEKPIVLASLVRSTRGKLSEFVRSFQRINVGLSRAQQLLVIVGAEDTWKHAEVPLPRLDGGAPIQAPVYRNIIELARQSGGRRLARQVLVG